MTKQEEIREGIARIVLGNTEPLSLVLANKLVDYLHSQGCVLRAGRELPDKEVCVYNYFTHRWEMVSEEGMEDAGYGAFESLIKEEESEVTER